MRTQARRRFLHSLDSSIDDVLLHTNTGSTSHSFGTRADTKTATFVEVDSYTGWPKKVSYCNMTISLLNIDQFSEFFHHANYDYTFGHLTLILSLHYLAKCMLLSLLFASGVNVCRLQSRWKRTFFLSTCCNKENVMWRVWLFKIQ